MSKECFICGEVEEVGPAGFGFLCQYEGKPICDICIAIVMQAAREGFGPLSPAVAQELHKIVVARSLAALGGEE